MTGISLFDVIGPNMVGPSSSHTAGAVSMALLARKIFYKEEKTKEQLMKRVDFTLYGSFAKTYKGHGTDRALLGGILGFATDDLRIRDAFSYAGKEGLEYTFTLSEEKDVHPNTADMDITGEYSTLIVSQTDKQGVAAHITKCLSDCGVNIAFMRIFREEKGARAYTVVESDEKIPKTVTEGIKENPHIMDVTLL